ncbi:unnamed protein product [Trichobilharzia szidati]|nr:unnamed protein product [Trichobilharzia szidati]
MNNPPQILIEPIVAERDITELAEKVEDVRSLTVPFSKFLIDVDNDAADDTVSVDGHNDNSPYNSKEVYLNFYENYFNSLEHSSSFGQTIIGKIFITPINKNPIDNDQEKQLVWVQIYQKSSSLSSKLNSQNVDIPSLVILLKSKTNPRNSQYIPDFCSPPYMRLNLKHTRSRQIDEKRFQIYTRCGEGITIQAETADENSVNFWLSVFNQNTLCTGPLECLRTLVPKPHSAPNSPRRTRRRDNLSINYTTDTVNNNNNNSSNLFNKTPGNSLSRTCVFETLSEVQEIESEV